MTVFDPTTGAQVQQAAISFSSSGDNTVVTGIFGKTIKVLQIMLVLSASSNLTFKSGASTSLSGAMAMLANGSIVLDYIQLPLTCNSGDNFVINQSGSASVGGVIWFAQI